MREGIKGMILILNPYPTRLSFYKSWSFNSYHSTCIVIFASKFPNIM